MKRIRSKNYSVPGLLKSIIKFIVFLLLGVGLLYWVFRSQDISYQAYCASHQIAPEDCILWKKMLKDFLSVKWIYIVFIFIAFFLSNYFRSLRWYLLLDPLGYKPHWINSLGAVLVSYLVNLGIPRSGEFVRAAVLSKYEKIPLDKAFGTVVLDRLVDMLSMFIIICFTILLQLPTFSKFYNDQLAQLPLVQKLIIPGLLILIILILWFTRNTWRKYPIVRTVKSKIQGFYEGLMVIKKIKQPRAFFFYTISIWFWFYVMLVCALKSFEPTSHISLASSLVIYVFGSLGMIVPTPGGMGSYHYLVILALAYYNIPPGDAFSFANISFFTAQFANNIILGIIGLISMYFFNKNYQPKHI